MAGEQRDPSRLRGGGSSARHRKTEGVSPFARLSGPSELGSGTKGSASLPSMPTRSTGKCQAEGVVEGVKSGRCCFNEQECPGIKEICFSLIGRANRWKCSWKEMHFRTAENKQEPQIWCIHIKSVTWNPQFVSSLPS
ncbi:uncharacterized protein LOC107202778 isoform X2 [Parus major]|uniref:uncharacterized protein LOC107202778 isoform X2 n=1 Tax=Parus major TaxID=9157 RepID=UPI0007712695|nr:uncharacterized protein LOC107202778 isoform X2 [Parus major]